MTGTRIYLRKLAEIEATDAALTGGKGANLARLTQLGLQVPGGFVVTTDAYSEFLGTDHLGDRLTALVSTINFDDPEAVEARAGEARQLILEAAMPQHVELAIRAAYKALGSEPYVAVRSSGTAEDLDDTSFAGMHDTYLDIRGEADLVDAVKRCWASLWTGRATAYRQRNRFVHPAVRIAVVVQVMVESETSGVMFTGNPLNTATDELVINASWGLGEAVVAGIVTPDEFTVSANTLQARRRTLGSKTIRIVRNRIGSSGTRTEDVPANMQEIYCLTDPQIAALAALGLRVQQAYDGFPQDIEWAYCKGEFLLLQARPITGVEFSWEADLDEWQRDVVDSEDIWTRALSDVAWSGAITPLMYSVRAPCWTASQLREFSLYGLEAEVKPQRFWKFHKSEAYFNCVVEKIRLDATVWPPLRPYVAECLPPAWREELVKSPFNEKAFELCYQRVESSISNQTLLEWHDTWADNYWRNPEAVALANGLSPEQLRALSDAELQAYIKKYCKLEELYFYDGLAGFFLHFKTMGTLLMLMCGKWYDGDPQVLYDLQAGVSERTATQLENHALWEMSEQILASPRLLEAFRSYQDDAFFHELEKSEEGRKLLATYRDFLAVHGHRGGAERDMYFIRRAESQAVTYEALKSLVNAGSSQDPMVREEALKEKHDRAVEKVLAHVRDNANGEAESEIPAWLAAIIRNQGKKTTREEVLRFTIAWMDEMAIVRDNERHFVDRYGFAIRKGLLELARRLTQRGKLHDEDDAWFLGLEELNRLFEGEKLSRLLEAKIAARRRDFVRMNNRETVAAPYLQHFSGLDLDTAAAQTEGGHIQGTPASRGTVTGTVCIVKNLKELHRVKSGDIMLCNATDPAWTPVFLIIRGIITETGGMLSHAFCLAREYGLPAVQVPNAMRLIPDGATVTLHGDTGVVIVHEEDLTAAAA